MSSLFEKVNQIGVLKTARNPFWQTETNPAANPATLAAGIALSGAVTMHAAIAPRAKDVNKKTSDISITYDAATTYTVTVNGVNINEAGDTDVATTLENLAAAINGNGTLEPIVDASYNADSGFLEIDGDDEYTLSVSVGGGAGTISIEYESSTVADVRIYVLPDGPSALRPVTWQVHPTHGEQNAIGRRGVNLRIPAAGYRRAYIGLVDSDHDVKVYYGPGREE